MLDLLFVNQSFHCTFKPHKDHPFQSWYVVLILRWLISKIDLYVSFVFGTANGHLKSELVLKVSFHWLTAAGTVKSL